MELIKLENVGISFKRQNKPPYWAIKDASFNIFEGETLGIIGSNGAGKSTLLRVIAGTYRIDKGTIKRETDSCSLLTLNLGFVPYLNGEDNVILSGMLQGLEKKHIVSKIPKIIEYTELSEMFYEPINTWSTGMVARLGFALALEVKPKILLIDETLSVGDASFQKKSELSIKSRINSNQTVVLVSHSVGVIESLCDRVVWVDKGVTKAQGKTKGIMEQYNSHIKNEVGKKIWV